MNRQEWRSQIFREVTTGSKRFNYALLCDDVERWTIIPTMRPQSVAEHSFNTAIIVDAFCEELGLGRGSATRMEALRWALWHDTDEIFTGDIPTPMKIQIPDHVMKVANELSGIHSHLEECGDALALKLVKLADITEACRFITMWGVEPSKGALLATMVGRLHNILDENPGMIGLGVMTVNFIEGGDVTWWMERLTPRNKSADSSSTSQRIANTKDSSSPSKTTLQIPHGQTTSQTLTKKERRGRRGSKK